MNQFVLIILGLLGGAVLVWGWNKFRQSKSSATTEHWQILSQRLDSINNGMHQALRDTVKMVTDQLEQSRQASERASQTVHKQVAGFTTGLTQLTENLK